MEITEMTSLITSVGFPIVMCLLMYKYVTDESKETRATLSMLESAIHALEKGVEDLIQISRMRYNIDEIHREEEKKK